MTDVTGATARGDVPAPDEAEGEKATLLAFLDYVRDALAAKAVGVTDEVGRTPGVPSGTSLLGLVKHLTAVERMWFVWGYAGRGEEKPDSRPGPVAENETTADVVAAYREAIRESNEIVLACDDLTRPGARSPRPKAPPSMRWVLVHMIEETARHAGHADILREQTDGAIGR
ncbi:DinB family protein [Streptomyces iconiensis]|uniref:DinB family protein n=1 Tax=Streptomyces iconiensis TaxID=1384038 RepID=A0ABT6ZWI5_9ACTN|nr:DinB family protein [Streptomyces iconiensis]MDJ1133431.1 DinB family protein [Streptomyces iconiensis]